MRYDLCRKRDLPVGSDIVAEKAPASASSGTGSNCRGAADRKRTPAPCSPSDAALKTIADAASPIGALVAERPTDRRQRDAPKSEWPRDIGDQRRAGMDAHEMMLCGACRRHTASSLSRFRAGRALVCRSRRGSLLGAEAARNRGKSITVTEAGVPASGDFKIAAVGAGAIDIPFVTSSTVGGKG